MYGYQATPWQESLQEGVACQGGSAVLEVGCGKVGELQLRQSQLPGEEHTHLALVSCWPANSWYVRPLEGHLS